MKKKRRKKEGRIDRPFLITLLCLIGIGLIMVFSASMYSSTVSGSSGSAQFYKQSAFAIVGLIIMFVLSKINYRIFLKPAVYNSLMGITLILLLCCKIPGIGYSVNGAERWVKIGFSFQPSEIAKMTGIIYIAATLVNKPDIISSNFGNNPGTKQLWIYCYSVIVLTCLLIVIEPSLSATLVIALGMMSVLWYSGLKLNQFIPFATIGLIGLSFFLTVSWRLTRILSLFGHSDVNWQIDQSLVAFGSGGLFGVGLGNGKQKLLFLPEIQNDFIFANIGEEFGLVGCLIVLLLYTYLIYRGFIIGSHCKDRFGFLYILSIMTVLGFQVFVNVAVATHTIPVTGMALPFISYGGTSIVILLTTIGPVLNISRTVKLVSKRKKVKKKVNENSNGSRRNRRSYISGNSNIRRTKEYI